MTATDHEVFAIAGGAASTASLLMAVWFGVMQTSVLRTHSEGSSLLQRNAKSVTQAKPMLCSWSWSWSWRCTSAHERSGHRNRGYVAERTEILDANSCLTDAMTVFVWAPETKACA